ncbi:MAG: hypothetical protein R2911_23845 [Caldilineaceae bacterium]
MSNTKTILISINLLAEVPAHLANDSDFNEFDRVVGEVTDAVETVESRFNLSWESTQTRTLNESTMNCGRCASCGRWVSDREKDNVIEQLNIGAVVDGNLLCDECLPRNHRWAF